jgi:hypothetical protein
MVGDKVRPAHSLADGLFKALDEVIGSPTATRLGLQVPRSVEELLHRAVARDPLARPRDAGVFWSQLKDAIATSPRSKAADDVAPAAPGLSPFLGTMLMPNAPPRTMPAVTTSPLAASMTSPPLGLRPDSARPPPAHPSGAPAPFAQQARPSPGSQPPPALVRPPRQQPQPPRSDDPRGAPDVRAGARPGAPSVPAPPLLRSKALAALFVIVCLGLAGGGLALYLSRVP